MKYWLFAVETTVWSAGISRVRLVILDEFHYHCHCHCRVAAHARARVCAYVVKKLIGQRLGVLPIHLLLHFLYVFTLAPARRTKDDRKAQRMRRRKSSKRTRKSIWFTQRYSNWISTTHPPPPPPPIPLPTVFFPFYFPIYFNFSVQSFLKFNQLWLHCNDIVESWHQVKRAVETMAL